MKRNISELSVEALQLYKEQEQEKINKVAHEQATLMNQMAELSKTMKKINEALDNKTLTIDNIPAILEKFPETKKRRQLLGKYLESLDLDDAGSYWADTNQSVVRIKLYLTDDEHTKRVHDGVLKVLPYIKPLKHGYKWIDIFEHTLSYNNSYYLGYLEEKKLFVVMTGIKDIWYENQDLMKVLKYIQKNLYYEENNPYLEDE